MVRTWLHRAGGWAARAFVAARLWLRRVMPKVAAAAAGLFVLRLFIRNLPAYQDGLLGVVGPLTFCAVLFVLLYYGLKLLVRLKRLLLWKVRRRLVITYLFVGLTPIVLLLILGYLGAMLGSGQAMVRLVTVEYRMTERRAREGARAVAEALLEAPTGGGQAARALEEQSRVLRSALPGARVAVWRGAEGAEAASLGEGAEAQLRSAQEGEEWRGVGADDGRVGEPLPAWLRGQTEWSGMSYLPPPAESTSAFGTPYLRALVRRAGGGRAVAVLVTVPVSRALLESLRESTGVNVRPFFLGVNSVQGASESGLTITVDEDDNEAAKQRAEAANGAPLKTVDFGRDQFGEPMPGTLFADFWFPVFLPTTDWTSGAQGTSWAFMVDWSWSAVWRQFWGGEEVGEFWWLLLIYTALVFLVLEVLALGSAAWMTRAVTGTVHKLYRATEFIKRGDFSHRIRTRSRDQLGELALAFNEMSANIENLLAERVERERLEREVEIAAEVQAQLFPRSVPALRSAEMTGECRAARGVAGDYYDYIEVAPGLVAFALGDVSGKGISASLVMSNLQAALRAQAAIVSERVRLAESRAQAATGGVPSAAHAGLEPAGDGAASPERLQVVAAMTASINGQLCRSTDSNRYATFFLAIFDDRTRLLRYTNAGHNPPVLVRADGRVETLSTGGTILGMFNFVTYEEAHVTLEDGDLLVVFSDGLSEARDPGGEEYGERRLSDFAAARRHDTAENLRQSIFDEIDRWTGDAERDDDQTLVILKATNMSGV